MNEKYAAFVYYENETEEQQSHSRSCFFLRVWFNVKVLRCQPLRNAHLFDYESGKMHYITRFP